MTLLHQVYKNTEMETNGWNTGKKGDNIHQCDRQQYQQTIKLPNVRSERHHNEEENQGARRKPS